MSNRGEVQKRPIAGVLLSVLLAIWIAQALYAIRLLVLDGSGAVLDWLHHVTPPLVNRGPLTMTTIWDVALTEGFLLVVTVVLWRLSGFARFRKHP